MRTVEVVRRCVQHEQKILRRNLARRDRTQRLQHPHRLGCHPRRVRLVRVGLLRRRRRWLLLPELRLKERRRKLVEEHQPQPRELALRALSEIDVQHERVRVHVLERLLDLLARVLPREPDQLIDLEVLDRRDVGQRLVPARRRQQRHVIPQALVSITLAEVEDLRALALRVPRLRQILPRRHHLHTLDVERPILRVVHHDENRHGSPPLGLPLPCRGPRPIAAIPRRRLPPRRRLCPTL